MVTIEGAPTAKKKRKRTQFTLVGFKTAMFGLEDEGKIRKMSAYVLEHRGSLRLSIGKNGWNQREGAERGTIYMLPDSKVAIQNAGRQNIYSAGKQQHISCNESAQ